MYTELFNPIYGTVDGLPVIVLGAVSTSNGPGVPAELDWVVADDDGMLRRVPMQAVKADVRFREGKWHDTAPGVMDDET